MSLGPCQAHGGSFIPMDSWSDISTVSKCATGLYLVPAMTTALTIWHVGKRYYSREGQMEDPKTERELLIPRSILEINSILKYLKNVDMMSPAYLLLIHQPGPCKDHWILSKGSGLLQT